MGLWVFVHTFQPIWVCKTTQVTGCTMLHPRMAGPPIPEDEDVTTTPQNVPWPEPQVRVRFWEPWILMN